MFGIMKAGKGFCHNTHFETIEEARSAFDSEIAETTKAYVATKHTIAEIGPFNKIIKQVEFRTRSGKTYNIVRLYTL